MPQHEVSDTHIVIITAERTFVLATMGNMGTKKHDNYIYGSGLAHEERVCKNRMKLHVQVPHATGALSEDTTGTNDQRRA